jgi:hypothetical protein
MLVRCKPTDRKAETHCCICGQGFQMTWERESGSERKEVLFEIQKTLCDHHRNNPGVDAHPRTEFVAPDHFGPFQPMKVAIASQAQRCA